MSAPPVTTELAHAQPSGSTPSGSALAQDFQQTYGKDGASVGPNGEQGHYNRITQRWEGADEHVVSSTQSGSTFPEEIGEQTKKTSFKDQVLGATKLFAGKAKGNDHEIAAGQALLDGQGLPAAQRAEEAVKKAQQ